MSTGNDNIMADVARFMQELMRQNKEQKGVISQYQAKVESLESQARLLADKFKDQSIRYESLSGKLRTLDEATGRLESRNQMLEGRIREQETVIASQDTRLSAQWYDLEMCFKLRGGGSFETLKTKRWYQPKGAIPDAYIQGRKVWNRETVAEWLQQTDDTLAAYNEKYCTGAKNPHGA